MLNLSRLLVFVPVTVILVVTPGPNTLYIIARGLHRGYRAGIISSLGILLGTLFHIAGAALGLAARLSSSTLVFSMIKYAGAAGGNHMSHTVFALLLSLTIAPNLAGHGSQSKWNAGASYFGRSTIAFVPDESEVLIRDGWVQEGPPSQTITAAYMTIENQSAAGISLKSASTEVAETVELHKMELVDGIMKMRRVETIDIPAGGMTELKPGGYHLMVIGLKKQLREGDRVTIVLEFSGGLRKPITIPVKPRSAMVKEG